MVKVKLLPPMTLRVDGKVYKKDSQYSEKFRAQKLAKWWRYQGKSARVVRKAGYWVVYWK